jgi:hypothetical protein
MKHAKGFLALVQDAKRRIKETDIATVRARVARGEKFHLIDVREDNEWERGHLPGATHLGKGIIERDIEQTIPDPNAEITAAGDTDPHWPPTRCSAWVMRAFFRWTAATVAGSKAAIR